MAPEQWEGTGEADGRSDVFGLGATLYQALTLELPYGTARLTTTSRPPARPGATQPGLGADFDAVILKALEPDPRDRYDSAEELAEDWGRVRAGLLPLARRAGPLRRIARRARRHPWVLAQVLLGGAAIGVLWFALSRPGMTAASDPDQPRRVELATDPPGARSIFVPLGPDDGNPVVEGAVAPPEGMVTPLTIDLRPGDYLVEVELPDGRFHQVRRHVPRLGGVLAGSYQHQRWAESPSGRVMLPTILIPRRDVAAGMAAFPAAASAMPAAVPENGTRSATIPAFRLDVTEVTVAQFCAVQSLPRELAGSDPRPDDPVSFVTFDAALDCAEKLGKRLPTEQEYWVAATGNGARRFPWGDDPAPLFGSAWAYGPAGTPPFDRTPTEPTVAGLCTNVAEWNSSWITSDSTVHRGPLPPDFREGRGVRGGLMGVLERKGDVPAYEIAPSLRHYVDRRFAYPGLGFRCARGERPEFLPPRRPTGGAAGR